MKKIQIKIYYLFILRHNKETNTDCYFMLEWDLSKMLKQRCTSRSSLITTRKAKCFVKTNCWHELNEQVLKDILFLTELKTGNNGSQQPQVGHENEHIKSKSGMFSS